MFNLLFFSPLADLLNCRYSTAKIPLFRSISCFYAMRRSDLSLMQSVLTPGCLVKLKVLMRISVRFHSLDLPPQIFSIYILSIETDSNLIFNINLIQSSNSFSWLFLLKYVLGLFSISVEPSQIEILWYGVVFVFSQLYSKASHVFPHVCRLRIMGIIGGQTDSH